MIAKKASPRIAIVHTGFGWIGGAEAVAVWALEALKEEYDITLFTISDLPFEKVNQFYGTKLTPSDFRLIQIPLPFGLNNTLKFWYLKRLLAMRYFRSIAKNYDLCISTYYEMDFGRKGIQYIHSPSFAAGMIPGLSEFLEECQRSYVKNFYRRLSTLVSGYSIERAKQNITLVNSNWTGKIIENIYGIKTQTVYPPVSSDFSYVPWNEKEDGFVCIGRLAPQKRVDMIIRILGQVRQAGWDIHLHIITGGGWERDYYAKVKQMQEENSSWVFLETNLSRKQLVNLVSQHKYGIHGMRNEHFGIAVAEMVKAGNIVFVPNDGGQVEIVGDERLTYESEEEAVEKIIQVLNDENLQFSLRRHLTTRSKLFSTHHFVQEMRKIVRQAL